MKIGPKKYAQLLYVLTKDGSKENVKVVISKFSKLLIKNNGLNLLNKIIIEFEKIYHKEKGIVKVDVKTANDLGDDYIRNQIVKYLNKEDVEIFAETDETLIGGIQLKVDDTLIDGSLRNRLARLKSRLVRS